LASHIDDADAVAAPLVAAATGASMARRGAASALLATPPGRALRQHRVASMLLRLMRAGAARSREPGRSSSGVGRAVAGASRHSSPRSDAALGAPPAWRVQRGTGQRSGSSWRYDPAALEDARVACSSCASAWLPARRDACCARLACRSAARTWPAPPRARSHMLQVRADRARACLHATAALRHAF
jgi:hypothetical protein